MRSSAKSTKLSGKSKITRDEPELPGELDLCERLQEGNVIIAHESRLKAIHLPGLRAEAVRVHSSVLEHVQFPGSSFGSTLWKDVRLVGCDLSNVRAYRMSLLRVEFIDCRLTGFITSDLDWHHVLIQNCDLSYSQVKGGKFRTCEFEDCKWQEADLQGADLTSAVFRRCNLSRADLRGATLQNADFRGSDIEGMVVGLNDLRGAIVDASQAMVLARLLGLQIL